MITLQKHGILDTDSPPAPSWTGRTSPPYPELSSPRPPWRPRAYENQRGAVEPSGSAWISIEDRAKSAKNPLKSLEIPLNIQEKGRRSLEKCVAPPHAWGGEPSIEKGLRVEISGPRGGQPGERPAQVSNMLQ